MVHIITSQSLKNPTCLGYLGQSENVGYLLNLAILLYLHLFSLTTDSWVPTEHLKITTPIQDKIMRSYGIVATIPGLFGTLCQELALVSTG